MKFYLDGYYKPKTINLIVNLSITVSFVKMILMSMYVMHFLSVFCIALYSIDKNKHTQYHIKTLRVFYWLDWVLSGFFVGKLPTFIYFQKIS